MRIDEIVNHVFTRAFMGYDIEQVDGFLDEIIETLERYEAEKREMLAAMEYLMKKIEYGQKVPLADMKKAIDSGRGQGNPVLSVDGQSEDEQKPAARTITRGNGGTNKPIRAPKVSRVKREEEAKAQIIEEAKAAIPQEELTQEEADRRAKRMSAAAVNWLDELLINIAEHETRETERPAAATEPIQPAEEPKTTTDPKPQPAPQPAPQPVPKATYTPQPAPQPTASAATPKPKEQPKAMPTQSAAQPTFAKTEEPKPQQPTQQPTHQPDSEPSAILKKMFEQASQNEE